MISLRAGRRKQAWICRAAGQDRRCMLAIERRNQFAIFPDRRLARPAISDGVAHQHAVVLVQQQHRLDSTQARRADIFAKLHSDGLRCHGDAFVHTARLQGGELPGDSSHQTHHRSAGQRSPQLRFTFCKDQKAASQTGGYKIFFCSVFGRC